MLTIIICYFIIGLLAGILSGLLGLGGGVVIVPALMILFEKQNFLPANLMHLAIGSSLAIVMFATMMTTYSQHKRKALAWNLLKVMIPGTVLGAIIGVVLGKQLSTQFLSYVFAAFCFLLAIKMLIGKENVQEHKKPQSPHPFILLGTAIVAGILAGLLGIGGGAILIPLLIWFGLPMVVVSGTSAACAFPTAFTGAISSIIVGLHTPGLPSYSTGFIYWPAVIIIGMSSMLAAPVGVYLAHHLPEKTIKRIFGGILLVIAWQMAS